MAYEEYFKFLEDNDLLNKFGRLISEKSKVPNKAELKEAHRQLQEFTKFLPQDTKFSYRTLIVEELQKGMQPGEEKCPVCGDLKKQSSKERRLEIVCKNRDKEHKDFITKTRNTSHSKTLQENPVVLTKEQQAQKQAKFEATCLAKFGAKSPLSKGTTTRTKGQSTIKKVYGVDNVMQNSAVQQKNSLSNIETAKDPKVQAQREATNIARRGVAMPMQDPTVVQTWQNDFSLNHNGAINPMQVKEFRDQALATNNLKYDCDYPMQNKDMQQSVKELCQELHGCDYYTQKNLRNMKDLNPIFVKETFIDSNNNFMARKMQEYFGYSNLTRPYQIVIEMGIEYEIRRRISEAELEIRDFLEKLIPNIIIEAGNKKILKGREIDIYLPEYNLAIEYNGLMWHSQGKSKYDKFNTPDFKATYHMRKTNQCEEQGIQLLHIFENEWLDPETKEGWKSLIANKLKVNSKKIMARKCKVVEITTKDERSLIHEFFNRNHMQGSAALGSIAFALIYEDRIVSVMTFGYLRFQEIVDKDNYELIRFATRKGINVPGGASRLLKAFEKHYNPKRLISYANRRWSDGGLYNTLGFNNMGITTPNYFYFKPNDYRLRSRHGFSKGRIEDKLETFDPNVSGNINAFNNGYRRIFDSGNHKFEKTYP